MHDPMMRIDLARQGCAVLASPLWLRGRPILLPILVSHTNLRRVLLVGRDWQGLSSWWGCEAALGG